MKELLKYFDISNNAIKIYLEGVGKFPLTLSEIHKIMPKSSDNEVKKYVDELIDKKLVLLINPKYSDIFPHYIFLPPFAAIINALSIANEIPEDEKGELTRKGSSIEKFQDTVLQDIEAISQDLIEIISNQTANNQTAEILSEVEKNVKKFSQVLLTEVNELIAKLKEKSIVNEIDIERVMRSITQKIGESEEIISNMFVQFRDIINEMDSPNTGSLVESFKTFIRRLGDSIDKRSNQIFQNPSSSSLINLQMVEQSLFNILTDYISKDQASVDRLLPLYNIEKIREIISLLFKNSKDSLLIIVPSLEDFMPLEEFDLNYSDAESEPSSTVLKKPVLPSTSKPTISKKLKKELEDKIDFTAKRVADLKGYELSHDVADILAKVSEINPESLIIENVQGWLNRLLVIRKYLDQNTQYLILDDIEKWKKDYLKIKKKEEPEQIDEKTPKEGIDNRITSSTGLDIKIVSSEPHNNKHVRALKNKAIDYLRLKNNSLLAIIGDNTYLAYAVCQKTKGESKYEITGFITSFKPIIDLIQPHILKFVKEAKPTREIQINVGFNQIIENINDYSGKKISKILKNLLNVAFEKDGISLNILEFKLLISKLEKLLYPLEDNLKTFVIEELNKLNREFSTLELVFPPEFRPPIIVDDPNEKLEQELKLNDKEIELLDSEKVNNLFDLFFEKIHDLKGVEIGDQIDKFIEVILRLQGYSQILEWKKDLAKFETTLDEPLKEKIKTDFLNWKMGILRPNNLKEETSSNSHVDLTPQKDYMAEIEKEYISPGLSQSQYQSDEFIPSESLDNIDPSQKMKELFEDIEQNFTELNGVEISKKIQNIVDLILETEGYSMELKNIKDWISKLKKIRNPLEEEIKEDFVLAFFNWKEKYSKGDTEIQSLNFGSTIESSSDIDEGNVVGKDNLNEKIDILIQTINTSTGSELSRGLQDISDIVLPSYGAVAANALRQWISKLRSIRDLLEDEIRQEFLEELEKWKVKFA
ncbi:MAG: hypothetical protein ACFE8B_11540 [Candidatus Hermodarchaeota archaeon]